STATLSVSSSQIGSSLLTWSPGCLNHWATVASVTLSPSVGTRISIIGSSSRQRRLHQLFLFALVHLQEPGRRGRALGPADVARPLMLVADLRQQRLDARRDEEPRAHVLRLLLAPD